MLSVHDVNVCVCVCVHLRCTSFVLCHRRNYRCAYNSLALGEKDEHGKTTSQRKIDIDIIPEKWFVVCLHIERRAKDRLLAAPSTMLF